MLKFSARSELRVNSVDLEVRENDQIIRAKMTTTCLEPYRSLKSWTSFSCQNYKHSAVADPDKILTRFWVRKTSQKWDFCPFSIKFGNFERVPQTFSPSLDLPLFRVFLYRKDLYVGCPKKSRQLCKGVAQLWNQIHEHVMFCFIEESLTEILSPIILGNQTNLDRVKRARRQKCTQTLKPEDPFINVLLLRAYILHRRFYLNIRL